MPAGIVLLVFITYVVTGVGDDANAADLARQVAAVQQQDGGGNGDNGFH